MRFGERGAVERVGGKIIGHAPGFVDGLGAFPATGGIAAEHGHLGAGGGEAFGQRATEHARGSDDDGNFRREIKEFRHNGFRQHRGNAATWQERLEGVSSGMHARIYMWLREAVITSAILIFLRASAG
ncbi:MAG: hypothetical protein WDN28_07130 [Chthoniobacter sp.]